jgi:hypothetical protein
MCPQNVRDMAFTESHDGGRTFSAPTRVSEDQWQIEGCPKMGRRLPWTPADKCTSWPTLVHYRRARNHRLESSTPHRVRVTPLAAAALKPTEGAPSSSNRRRQGSVCLAGMNSKRFTPGRCGSSSVDRRERRWARDVLSGDVPGTYPSIVSSGAVVIVAWTSGVPNSVIRVSATSF